MNSACNYLSPQEHDDRNVRFPAQRDDSNNDDDDDESDEGSNNGQLFACQLEFESVFTELLRSYSVPDLNFMRQNLHQLSHKSISSALTRSVSRK